MYHKIHSTGEGSGAPACALNLVSFTRQIPSPGKFLAEARILICWPPSNKIIAGNRKKPNKSLSWGKSHFFLYMGLKGWAWGTMGGRIWLLKSTWKRILWYKLHPNPAGTRAKRMTTDKVCKGLGWENLGLKPRKAWKVKLKPAWD